MRWIAALAVFAVIWLAGLVAFADRVERMTPAADPGRADGIVVLTGVSGVNRQVQREELRAITPGSNRLFDCCVDLGFDAEDTVGNAEEIAAWSRAKGYDSLIVVTSDYHMARAMLEIRGQMHDAELIPYAVLTPSLDADSWWRSGTGVRRMTLEYSKYLAVLVREAAARMVSGGAAAEPALAAETE